MPAGVSYGTYNADSDRSSMYQTDHNHNTTQILKSVKEQEAQFERLTRELEAERQKVAYKAQQYRIGSETESMNSISSTDDNTFQWGGPQDDSVRYGDESHGLMDSCLQELENRGAMNFGEDNMNYMPEDQYGGRGGPYSPDYNSYNGGPHLDTSLHSSHHSLHSNSNNPRAQMKLSNQNLGSRSNIPQDGVHPSDNYAPYTSLPRGNYDDYRGSPVPSNGSPRGAGTPTRFNNYYGDNYGDRDSYRQSPVAYNDPGGYGDQDRYDANPMQQYQPQDSSFHNDSFRGPPPDDRYGVGGGGPPEDSFYRQSPMLDQRYGGGAPDDMRQDYRGVDPRDNYMDSPRGGGGGQYPGDDRYHDNSFQGQPDSYQGQPDSFHGQPDSYTGPNSMTDRYADGPMDPQMRSMDDRYRDQMDDSYRGPGQDDSFRGPVSQDDRYRDYEDGPRRDDPGDRYGDQPTSQSFQDLPGNSYHDAPSNGYHDNMPSRGYEDDSFQQDPNTRRHEGLPQVQDDPFADDPFRQKQRSLLQLQQQEDPYPRGPSPGASSDRIGPGGYPDHQQQYEGNGGGGQFDQEPPGQYFDDRMGPPRMNGQVEGYPDDGQRTPSVSGGTMRWRAPDLQEVIEYLSHPNDAVKANSAAYLTHLSYMDDGVKQKIRGLDGIPLLVDLLNSEYHEVHKNACGALKNLSYGRSNDENKKAIKNAGGIPALFRLLRKTRDDDVKDSVTGVLWNLSSCDDLKMPIIDDGLAVIVNVVIIPESGWETRGMSNYSPRLTTVFRNATGVLRNVSSAGEIARKKLRECHGLVDSLIYTLKNAIDQKDVDNNPIQNCVCTLRNLAFRIQEVEDPFFHTKRNATLQRQKKQEKNAEKPGCFGGSKKKSGQKGKQTEEDVAQPRLPPTANEYKGLWGFETVSYFLQLLVGSNPTMLEAACGAIQNLSACDWRPAIDIRALVRKEKGLPSLVDLLTFEEERVVGASARALRNLSIDEKNKALVGKYAMKQLISNLPQGNRGKELTDDTVSAVLACLHEVIQQNQDFARAFCTDGGLPRLMSLLKSDAYTPRTRKFGAAVSKSLWKFKVLHGEFQKQGYTEKDFNPVISTSPYHGQGTTSGSSNYGTISRPTGGQGYDETTLPLRTNRGNNGHPANFNSRVEGLSNPALDQRDNYGGSQQMIPMNDIGYAPIDESNHRKKPPAGAVPLFPNMPPGQGGSGSPMSEPLYAKVNKQTRHREDMDAPPSPNHVMVGGTDPGQEGVDSWV